MATDIQSIEFLKIEYDKNKALEWLRSNHYPDPEGKLKSSGNHYTYEVRPASIFGTRYAHESRVGGITFKYGTYKISSISRNKHPLRRDKEKTEQLAKVLVRAFDIKKMPETQRGRTLEDATELAGSGIQSVRVPKKMGLKKARQWVDNKGWSASYEGYSPFTETKNWYRFRQAPATKNKKYSIKTLPNKVQIVSNY